MPIVPFTIFHGEAGELLFIVGENETDEFLYQQC